MTSGILAMVSPSALACVYDYNARTIVSTLAAMANARLG
jgi:hypothetical protein